MGRVWGRAGGIVVNMRVLELELTRSRMGRGRRV